MARQERSQDVFSAVTQQLAALERHDWELWGIVTLAGVVVSVGLLALLIPAAFLQQDAIRFEVTASRQLVVGLIVLLVLFNSYLITQRHELRRVRQKADLQHHTKRASQASVLHRPTDRGLQSPFSGRDGWTVYQPRTSLTKAAAVHAHRLRSVQRGQHAFWHLTGDFVLAEIAALLKSSVRGSDAVVRYGGDEFLVVLADTPASDAGKVVERTRGYLRDWNTQRKLGLI